MAARTTGSCAGSRRTRARCSAYAAQGPRQGPSRACRPTGPVRPRAVPASPALTAAELSAAELRPAALGAAEPAAGALAAALGRFRTRAQRQRAGVLLRRHLTAAALLGIALQAFVLAGLIPQWALLAVLVALALALTLALRRPVPLEGVARLLDERLGLFDQLATALEIEQRGTAAKRPLERRAIARTTAMLQSDSAQWRVRPSRASGEWLGLGACLAVLALLVGLSASGAVGAGSESRAGVGQGLTSGHTGGHAGGKAGGRANTNKNHQHTASARTPELPGKVGRVTLPPQVKKALGNHVTATRSGLHSSQSKATSGKSSTSSTSQSPRSEISPVSRSTPTSAPHQHALPTPHSHGGPTPSTKASSHRSQGHPGGSRQQSKSAGRHPGGNTVAGHEPGLDLRRIGTPPRERVSELLHLSLPAGYVPTHSRGKGEIGKGAEKVEGGGGHGRSASVGGEGSPSSTGAGGFAYVPPDGGASGEGQASLLERYFEHQRPLEQELASW